MKNLKSALLIGAALLFAAAPIRLEAASPGQWTSGGFTQWHANDGKTPLGVAGTQCYFCKPDAAAPAPAPTPAPAAAAPPKEDNKCSNVPNGATLDSRGCWVLKNLNFKTNSAKIEPKDMNVVKDAAKVLKQNPDVSVEIQGHTDNVGNAPYNKKLSDRRANEVMANLAKEGVNKKQMTARGYGLEIPVASNDTIQGRAENRRVELNVTGKTPAVAEQKAAPVKKKAVKKKASKKSVAKKADATSKKPAVTKK